MQFEFRHVKSLVVLGIFFFISGCTSPKLMLSEYQSEFDRLEIAKSSEEQVATIKRLHNLRPKYHRTTSAYTPQIVYYGLIENGETIPIGDDRFNESLTKLVVFNANEKAPVGKPVLLNLNGPEVVRTIRNLLNNCTAVKAETR